jgi:drug/metabolite transporter (DMT)-like permease
VKTLTRYTPLIFVALWSTGFVGAKYIIPYAQPFVFLTMRYALATAILILIAKVLREPLRISREHVIQSIKVGLFLQVIYIGGVFYSVSHGVSAGVTSVIVSMQPIVVSVLGVRILNEPLNLRKISGLLLGFLGVFILLNPKIIEGVIDFQFSTAGMTASLIALIGTTAGYLLQKKGGSDIPFLPGTAIQFATAACAFAISALLFEDWQVDFNIRFIAALSWFVLALSIGSIFLLFFLLRNESASSVSSLYYLVPPLTALQAYLLFGEKIAPVGFLGLFLAVSGTLLVTYKK